MVDDSAAIDDDTAEALTNARNSNGMTTIGEGEELGERQLSW